MYEGSEHQSNVLQNSSTSHTKSRQEKSPGKHIKYTKKLKQETYLKLLQKCKMIILHPCWPSQTLTFLSWPNWIHHEFGHSCKKESNMFVLVKMLDFGKISPHYLITGSSGILHICHNTLQILSLQKSGHILREKYYLWTTANWVGGCGPDGIIHLWHFSMSWST